MTESPFRERNYLCKFSIATTIYDRELPAKIRDKLNSLTLSVDTEKYYAIDISFDTQNYNDKEFYSFPVERKPWQIENLKKQSQHEQLQTVVSEILSQQLDNVCKELQTLSLPFNNAAIIGDELDDTKRVDVEIYESYRQRTEAVSTNKKAKKEKMYTVHSIFPTRLATVRKFAELLGEKLYQDMRQERIKEAQKAEHVANNITAEKLFTALAQAIIKENSSDLPPEALANEMIVHSQIRNDWPLTICGDKFSDFEDRALKPNDEIDCPEYLLYTEMKSSWTLEKVISLDVAKVKILRDGFNKKSVKNIIVLHNLKPIFYNLFAENNGEIIPVKKDEAHTHKKLLISWVN